MTTSALHLARAASTDAVRGVYDQAARALRVHEEIWEEEFRNAPNPFVAVQQYTSAAAREKRSRIVGEFHAAHDALTRKRGGQ